MDKNVLVIGGSGFLGSRLTKRFKNKKIDFKIGDISIQNSSNNSFICDVTDLDHNPIFNEVSCIINLAAVHRDDIRPISLYDDVNVQGSVNVCNAARKHKINKIIFTSSVAIYGFAEPNTDESGEPNYFNDYGRTKYLAEKIYMEWQAEDPEKRTLVIVRPTVIFGEGNRGNVYNLLKQVSSGMFVMFGNGKNRKSMAYVENVAAFLEHSLSFKKGLHIYNYIDKPDFDMNTLIIKIRKTLFGKRNIGLRLPSFLGIAIGKIADFLARILGKTLPISAIRVKKFMSTTQFSSSINATNFEPPVSLDEGLARTLNYEFLEDNSEKQTFETE